MHWGSVQTQLKVKRTNPPSVVSGVPAKAAPPTITRPGSGSFALTSAQSATGSRRCRLTKSSTAVSYSTLKPKEVRLWDSAKSETNTSTWKLPLHSRDCWSLMVSVSAPAVEAVASASANSAARTARSPNLPMIP